MSPNEPDLGSLLWRRVNHRAVAGPILAACIILGMAASLFPAAERELGRQPGSGVLALFVFVVILVILLAASFAFQAHYFRLLTVRKRNDLDKAGFVRMAADSIRTPLTGIRWLTELFLAGELGDMSGAQKDSIANMESAVRRLIGLVNELLAVMRLCGGVINYAPKMTDLKDTAKKAMQDMRPVAQGKRQQIGFGSGTEDVTIPIDQPLIRHLLATLTSCAVRLGDVGSTVVLHTESTETEAMVGITYSGTSIDVQGGAPGDEALPTSFPSLGDIDLTLSWEILAAAKGRVWVKHKTNEHTLYVVLPREWKEKHAWLKAPEGGQAAAPAAA